MDKRRALSQVPDSRLRPLWKILLTLAFAGLSVVAIGGGSASALASSQTAQQSPVAVLAASYQAMDTAMNAATPAGMSAVHAVSVPAAARVQVSSSANGVFLYHYDIYRIQTFAAWANLHAQDYSHINVWSTFQVSSVNVTGGSAVVRGVETHHIDATIRNNGQSHQFSPAKQAAQAWIKQAGLFLDFGRTNNAVALISHTATLSKVGSRWTIETDAYWDPLARALTPDHRSVSVASATATSSGVAQPQVVRPLISFAYSRQSAIQYADAWYNSCNSKYNCYMTQGVDCANFVSEAIYDESGGNLPGDNAWYSINHADTFDFVNVGGLYSHTVTYFAASTYSSYSYSTAAFDDDWFEYPGDLIFYDWGQVFGFGAADGYLDHVAVSVTQDANGYTYEDAHTTNLWHYYWDLGGGTQTGYFFLVMRNSG